MREGLEQVGAQHEPAPAEDLGEGHVPHRERLPGAHPLGALHGLDGAHRVRPGQQDAGLLERLADRGDHGAPRPAEVVLDAEPARPVRGAGPGPVEGLVVVGLEGPAGEPDGAER